MIIQVDEHNGDISYKAKELPYEIIGIVPHPTSKYGEAIIMLSRQQNCSEPWILKSDGCHSGRESFDTFYEMYKMLHGLGYCPDDKKVKIFSYSHLPEYMYK